MIEFLAYALGLWVFGGVATHIYLAMKGNRTELLDTLATWPWIVRDLTK